MTDSVLSILLIVSFFAVAALVRWFKTLDNGFWAIAQTPMVAGLIAGAIIVAAGRLTRIDTPVVIGVVLTAAALYVRLTGDESEPTEGMLLGAVLGAAAAVPVIFFADDDAIHLAECLLAGAVAGFGITFAALHVIARGRQLLLDAVTAALAIGAAELPRLSGMPSRDAAIASAAAIPLVVLLTIFKQWPDVRAELRHEASLGFIDDQDVRRTAHPFLRHSRAGWRDPNAHRVFVRLANRLALRKRQQRSRPDEVARLHQLEIIKLRMQIQEMSRINRAVANASPRAEDEGASDTMTAERMRHE
ncbi:MAG: hypothetical protein JWO56_1377 [Acidobacteria bacterium]|nr:hypothetical protein [Acidobacteriota bacterium]